MDSIPHGLKGRAGATAITAGAITAHPAEAENESSGAQPGAPPHPDLDHAPDSSVPALNAA